MHQRTVGALDAIRRLTGVRGARGLLDA